MVSGAFLSGEHFVGNVEDLACDLIGREIIVRDQSTGLVKHGIIVETEAYGGVEDPASHAAFRPGGRAAAMFGPPGVVYVYAAYGMYPCLNVVTNPVGEPSAVLIRGIELPEHAGLIHGPGRVSRYLGVTLVDHGRSIGEGRFDISFARCPCVIQDGPRVGITRGVDLPWRFVGAMTETGM